MRRLGDSIAVLRTVTIACACALFAAAGCSREDCHPVPAGEAFVVSSCTPQPGRVRNIRLTPLPADGVTRPVDLLRVEWDAAVNATSYQIIGSTPFDPQVDLGTFPRSPAEIVDPMVWRLQVSVESLNGGLIGYPASGATLERIDPALAITGFAATGNAHSIDLRFELPPGATDVDLEAVEDNGRVRQVTSLHDVGDDFITSGFRLGTHFHYRARARKGRGVAGPLAELDAATLAALPVPQTLRATRASNGTVSLEWDAPPVDTGCCELEKDGAPVGSDDHEGAASPTSTTVKVDQRGQTVTFRARSFDGWGNTSAYGPPLAVLLPPGTPDRLVLTPGVLTMAVDWIAAPGAVDHRVVRWAGGLATELPATAAPHLVDPLQTAGSVYYSVTARNAAGSGPTVSSYSLEPYAPTDAANLGAPGTPIAVDGAHLPSQGFVVSRAGYLKSIELAAACAAPGCGQNLRVELYRGDRLLGSAPLGTAACCAPPALSATERRGSIASFGDGLLVEPGPLRFRVLGDVRGGALLGTTAARYAGGDLLADRTTPLEAGLAFKVELEAWPGGLPYPWLAAPQRALGGTLVAWVPAPEAVSYTVYRTDGGSRAPIATTTGSSLLLPGVWKCCDLSLVVAALGADGHTRETPSIGASGGSGVTAQSLGLDGQLDGASTLVQPFTAQTAGRLSGVELALALGPAGDWWLRRFTIDLLDEAGALLGTADSEGGGSVFVGPLDGCCAAPRPLDDVLLGAGHAMFSPTIPVAAGQRLQLRVRAPGKVLGAGGSADSGLTVGGVARSDRTLTYRAILE